MKRTLSIVLALATIAGSTLAAAPKAPSLKGRDPDRLVFVLGGPSQPLDPNIYTTLNEAQVMREVYEPLIGMKSDDSFFPLLASEIPSSANGGISQDGSVYTVKLRKGVKFHNGSAFTADDVIFSFNRILHHPKSSAKSMFSAIMAVEKVDDYQVRIHFGRLKSAEYATVAMTSWADRAKYMTPSPYGPALNILAHYCSGMEDSESVEAAGADYGTKVVIGTGPYKFVSWPNPQEINLERNDAWWGGASTVAFKNVLFKTISEQPQVNNVLMTGEVDMAFNLSRLDFASMEKAGVVMTQKAGVMIWYGVFNMNSDLVGQKRGGKLDLTGSYDVQDSTNLRNAIFHSINPIPFIRQVDLFNGAAVPANQMMQPGFIGYVAAPKAGSPMAAFTEKSWYFDSAKAKAFFAKLSPGFLARLAPESITLAVGNVTDRVKIANNVKDQVKRTLGVDLIKVVPMVNSQVIQMSKTGDGYDMVVTGWFTPTMDSDYTCIIFNGESIGTGMNGALYNNDIVNESIQKARYTIDPKARAAAYEAAQNQLMADKPYFPLVYEKVIFGTHPRVGNLAEAIFKTKLVDIHKLTKAD